MPRRESQAVKNLRKIPGPFTQVSPLQNEWAAQTYRRQVKEFITNNKDKHWDGLDFSIHSRTHYVIFSFHDIYMFLVHKYKQPLLTVHNNFQNSLCNESFLKVRRTPHGTVYAFTAPKKRLDRWFKQNMNRFNHQPRLSYI